MHTENIQEYGTLELKESKDNRCNYENTLTESLHNLIHKHCKKSNTIIKVNVAKKINSVSSAHRINVNTRLNKKKANSYAIKIKKSPFKIENQNDFLNNLKSLLVTHHTPVTSNTRNHSSSYKKYEKDLLSLSIIDLSNKRHTYWLKLKDVKTKKLAPTSLSPYFRNSKSTTKDLHMRMANWQLSTLKNLNENKWPIVNSMECTTKKLYYRPSKIPKHKCQDKSFGTSFTIYKIQRSNYKPTKS